MKINRQQLRKLIMETLNEQAEKKTEDVDELKDVEEFLKVFGLPGKDRDENK